MKTNKATDKTASAPETRKYCQNCGIALDAGGGCGICKPTKATGEGDAPHYGTGSSGGKLTAWDGSLTPPSATGVPRENVMDQWEIRAWRRQVSTEVAARAEVEQMLEQVTAQRDELLTALKRIAYEPQGPPDASFADVLRACEQIARAAISKAEGSRD